MLFKKKNCYSPDKPIIHIFLAKRPTKLFCFQIFFGMFELLEQCYQLYCLCLFGLQSALILKLGRVYKWWNIINLVSIQGRAHPTRRENTWMMNACEKTLLVRFFSSFFIVALYHDEVCELSFCLALQPLLTSRSLKVWQYREVV